jgi:hypothetical protein
MVNEPQYGINSPHITDCMALVRKPTLSIIPFKVLASGDHRRNDIARKDVYNAWRKTSICTLCQTQSQRPNVPFPVTLCLQQ